MRRPGRRITDSFQDGPPVEPGDPSQKRLQQDSSNQWIQLTPSQEEATT